MSARIAMVLMFGALAACGGGQQEDVVSMAKSRGSLQCGPAGAPLSDLPGAQIVPCN